MLNFTRQERIVIYFLIGTLCTGAIIKVVRNKRLDEQLRPTRFYAEEKRFKEVSAHINSGELVLVDSSEDMDSQSAENEVLHPDSSAIRFEKINLNTAEVSQLVELPGIGPAIAKRIKTYTDQNGPFKNKADIILVKGIGKILYARIEGLVTIE